MPENDPIQPLPELPDLGALRRLLAGQETGQGEAIGEAALGSLPAPMSTWAEWLDIVTSEGDAGQLGERTLGRADKAAEPLGKHGALQEADAAQLGQLGPPHTPLGTRSRGLDRLWDLHNGRTPDQQRNARKNARNQERGRGR